MRCPTCQSEVADGTAVCASCTAPLSDLSWQLARASAAPPTATVEPPSPPRQRQPGRFAPGEVIGGRYRILHSLGHGGMGEVYRADDLTLDQPVALKFLPTDAERDPQRLMLLLREVRLSRQITHPNVCRVYDIGQASGLRFLSMEYIDGEDLASLLRRAGRLTPERGMEIGREICRGLGAAHEAGILHRDLKPANLMIDRRGQARITDFGIAAIVGTVEGREVRRGTPGYMAPEQKEGREVTVRSDLYALGLVLWEILTGKPEAARRAPRPALGQLVAGLDPQVEAVVERCLAHDPGERPASVREVAMALGEGAAPVWRPALELRVPHRRHWVLERRLGEGGFGEAWLAVHDVTGERRVFKFCPEASRLSALRREVTLFRLLQEQLGPREDIVRILDWNLDEPPWFVESEYTAGGDLIAWTEEQGGLDRVPLALRLELVAQVAEALAAAHSVGVLHKDVKPANVLVSGPPDAPRIRLADFGIGRVLDAGRLAAAGITLMGLTQTEIGDSAATGTPLYRAPELRDGEAATLQADVYALGVMLYQLVVGDLESAPGPGWEHDVDDEVLREEIAAAADRSPRRRLADAGQLAERLRTLPARREQRAAERRTRRQAELDRQALARAGRRRRALALIATVAVAVATVVTFQASRLAREADRRRNMTRVAVAGEWLERDPTRAAAVLLEVEEPQATPFVVTRMRQVLGHSLAAFELHHGAVIVAGGWSAGGRILTASEDGIARISAADGCEMRSSKLCPAGLTTASWSGDGSRILAACVDGKVRVWDPSRPGAEALVLDGGGEGGGGAAWNAVWSPDGGRIAAGFEDGSVRVWPSTGGDPEVLEGHAAHVTVLAWSADGARLATASHDGTARIWQPGDAGRPLHAVLPHGGRMWAAAWSADGQRLLTAANDDLAKIWSPGSLDAPVVLAGHGEDVRVAVWSSDGRWVMTASRDQTLRLWPLGGDGGEPIVLSGHEGGLRAASWSPDGRFLLSAAEDGTARIWRGTTALAANEEPPAPVRVLAGHDTWVRVASWSPDGRSVLTASGSTARLWRLGDSLDHPWQREPAVLAGHGAAVVGAWWSGDGRRIVTASLDGTARVFTLGSKAPPTLLKGGGAILRAAWSPGDDRILTSGPDGAARIWRTDGAGEPQVHSGHQLQVTDVGWHPDGDRVVTASADGTAWIRHLGGDREPVILHHSGTVELAAWNVTGRRLLTAAGETVQVWLDGEDDVPPLVLEGHTAAITDAVWSPAGDRIASASVDGTARIHDLRSGSTIVLDHGATTSLRSVGWSPDGDRIAVGLDNGGLRVWSAEGAGEPLLLDGHHFLITSVAFSPDGEHLVSTSVSAIDPIRLWRTDGQGESLLFPGHEDGVEMAAWNPAGDRLVSASRDGTARVWRASTADLIAHLESVTAVCLEVEARIRVLGDEAGDARRRHADCERRQCRRAHPPGRGGPD